jgi:transketolase
LLARLKAGRLPEGWEQKLRAWRDEAAAKAPKQTGIKSSAAIAQRVADAIPELMVGSADLNGTMQHGTSLVPFEAANHGGRYIAFGVREHAMGAMMNGMAAHGGVLPLGTTFLAFSDYQRPAIRMAALMALPALFVFSHDSIGVGKLGPTHQPVEHLAALRAIPNLLVLRPADAVETAECWAAALANRGGPSALVLSRQPLAPVRTDAGGDNRSAHGAYVLAEATGGARRVTLLSTGAEVAVALAARDMLEAEGVPTAVVSMPCWELFERQDAAWRAAVIPTGTVRVAVEAAVRLGWDRWIGEGGAFVGMASFGASGPEAELFAHFGITAERVAEEARRRL